MSAAAPNTDFIIYNIPQLAGVALTQGLFAEMRKNPRVIGVKNSSMPVQDIQMFKQAAGDDYIIFNGPDALHDVDLAAGDVLRAAVDELLHRKPYCCVLHPSDNHTGYWWNLWCNA